MRLFLVAGIVFSTGVANSFPIVTSFEPPKWVPGPANQNGWSDSSGGKGYTVDNTFARTGTQSIKWDGVAGGIHLFPPAFGVSGITVTSNVSVYIESEGTSWHRHGLGAYARGGGFFGWIGFQPNGEVWTDSQQTGWHYTGIIIDNPMGRWTEVSLIIDVNKGGSITGSVDGIPVNIGKVLGANPILDHIAIQSNCIGNGGTVFFDDYIAVPEPFSALAIGTGLALMAVRRRLCFRADRPGRA